MVLFKDLNKSASDVLSRDFVHNKRWDLEIRQSNKAATVTHCASSGGAAGGSSSNDGAEGGSPAGGVSGPPPDMSAAAKFAADFGHVEMKLGNKLSTVECQIKPQQVQGLVLSAKRVAKAAATTGGGGSSSSGSSKLRSSSTGGTSVGSAASPREGGISAGPAAAAATPVSTTPAAPPSIELASEYQLGGAHGRFVYNPSSSVWSASVLNTSKVGQDFAVVRVGGELSGDHFALDTSGLKYAVGAAIVKDHKPAAAGGGGTPLTWTASVKTAQHRDAVFGKVVAQFHTTTTGDKTAPQIAAEVQHIIAEQKTTLAIAGSWTLLPESGKTAAASLSSSSSSSSSSASSPAAGPTTVKVKLGHDGLLAYSLTHKLTSQISATIGGQTDPNNFQSPDATKMGVKLTFH